MGDRAFEKASTSLWEAIDLSTGHIGYLGMSKHSVGRSSAQGVEHRNLEVYRSWIEQGDAVMRDTFDMLHLQ